MKTKVLLLVGYLLIHSLLQAQKFTISGYIEATESGEKLIAANVFEAQSAAGTTSNTYGFYSLTLPATDSLTLSFSYIGYQSKEIRISLKKDMELNVQLSESINLQTVEVTSEKINRIEQKTQMSQVEVPVKQIELLPALLGEVDVLKALQLLPGVQAGGEGQSGFYVRGGSPDQNLILLDGVPIYNASHVLGLFSVFNADAIKNVTLTKGGFPARYGGRLSSVVEINMKEGNLQEWHGKGSIGLVSSKMTLEGPISKGKTSLLLSGRRTYIDLIARPFIRSAARRNEGTDVRPQAYFYDLNAKIQHKFNDKHRLFLSTYSGADVLGFRIKEDSENFDFKTDWDNRIGALRWNWQINNRLFSNTTLTYSRYNLDIGAGYEDTQADPPERFTNTYRSGIEDWAAKVDFDFLPTPNHYIRFGISAISHLYRPGALTLKTNVDDVQQDTTLGSQNVRAQEYAIYIEDDLQWGRLRANIGLHASAFNVENTFYASLQPRLGLRYLLPGDVALKASYSTMTQFINLLTSESLSLPADLWVPSTDRVRPQESWQAAIGAAKTIKDKFEISIEGFYKEMDNVISFKEGASFLTSFGSDWQDKVTQGKGDAYGVEFFLQKKKGKTTGWIGYTLSWNWRQFDEINGGNRFAFRYDRRHDISVVLSHKFSEKVTGSIAWVYGTGNAFTAPRYRFQTEAPEIFTWQDADGNVFTSDPYTVDIAVTGDKNKFRMSNFHRLDCSLVFSKQKKRVKRTWTVGAYNAYNHVNPYFVSQVRETTYQPDGTSTQQTVLKEFGLLPIIPMINYGLEF